MKPWERLRDWLESPESDVRTRAWQETDVTAIEARYGVRLPEGYREFLLNAAPVRDDDLDAELGSWWTPLRVRNIPDEVDWATSNPAVAQAATEWLFFLDHFTWSWAWAICCRKGEQHGRVAVITGGGKDRVVADSFSEFVDRYLTNWQSLC